MMKKPNLSWLHGGGKANCRTPAFLGFRIPATTWLTTVWFVPLWRGGTRRLLASTFRLGRCGMFAASPHWRHAPVPRVHITGRGDENDGDILGVWSGWCSYWVRKDQRCTLLIWLLAEDFQGAFEGVVGFGDWVWWCDWGGAEVAGPGCPHIFAILGGDHALH